LAKLYPDSHVEIKGILARYYEYFLNIGTLGRYRKFIARAVSDMNIAPGDKILDLGAGGGYNASFMKKYLGEDGEIVGLDVSEDGISRFRQKFGDVPNIRIENRRIDKPLPYESEFDMVFTSFVIHGLPHSARKKTLENVKKALKPGGKFFILDYGDFTLTELPFYLRLPFKIAECRYAYDYLERDWQEILEDFGFTFLKNHEYFHGFARLMEVEK